jgi:hypothetical protein
MTRPNAAESLTNYTDAVPFVSHARSRTGKDKTTRSAHPRIEREHKSPTCKGVNQFPYHGKLRQDTQVHVMLYWAGDSAARLGWSSALEPKYKTKYKATALKLLPRAGERP